MADAAALIFVVICLFQTILGVEWTRHHNKPQHNVGNVVNLHNMIVCATPCDPMSLNPYGHYCGLGGSGVPVDDIDSCCEQHDVCYDENTQLYSCWRPGIYGWPYDWSCNNGYPACHDGFDKCGFWTCVCDKAFTECLNESGCPKQSEKNYDPVLDKVPIVDTSTVV